MTRVKKSGIKTVDNEQEREREKKRKKNRSSKLINILFEYDHVVIQKKYLKKKKHDHKDNIKKKKYCKKRSNLREKKCRAIHPNVFFKLTKIFVDFLFFV